MKNLRTSFAATLLLLICLMMQGCSFAEPTPEQFVGLVFACAVVCSLILFSFIHAAEKQICRSGASLLLATILAVSIALLCSGCAAYHGERWTFATPLTKAEFSDGSSIDAKLIPENIGVLK